MRLYVIGPVSGRENDNREEFEDARRQLEAAGFKAVIPHDKIEAGTQWADAMRASIKELLATYRGKPRYDGVAELPGVFGSKGARCERGICEQLGIPHKTVAEWCGGCGAWRVRNYRARTGMPASPGTSQRAAATAASS